MDTMRNTSTGSKAGLGIVLAILIGGLLLLLSWLFRFPWDYIGP